MTWENILKEMTLDEIEEIVGKTGSLDELTEMIEKKFAVKTKMISSSSSSPIIGFSIPIYVSLEMVGNKTEEFEIVSTGGAEMSWKKIIKNVMTRSQVEGALQINIPSYEKRYKRYFNKETNKKVVVITDTRGAFVTKLHIDNMGVISLEFDNGKRTVIGEMDTSLEELRKLKKIPLFKVEIVGLREVFSRAENETYR